MSAKSQNGKRWFLFVMAILGVSTIVKLFFAFEHSDPGNRIALAALQLVGGAVIFGLPAYGLGWFFGKEEPSGVASGRATKETSKPLPPASKSYDIESDAILNERLYQVIADEIDSGNRHSGIWTRAFAESNGDPTQTRVRYIKLRLAQLTLLEKDRIALACAEEQKPTHPEVHSHPIVAANEFTDTRTVLFARLWTTPHDDEVADLIKRGIARQFLVSCRTGQSEEVDKLIKAHPYLVCVHDEDGNTGLHHAVLHRNRPILLTLVDSGAWIDAKNKSLKSALDYAAEQVGSKALSDIRPLLEAAANQQRQIQTDAARRGSDTHWFDFIRPS